jgi:hypothetical protein
VLNIAARPSLYTHEGEVIVSGVVFHDTNGNQRNDARERGLPNISVISQASDVQGGAVNASTTTAADGSFSIQTHVGDRISVVPGAGYKVLTSSGVIVRAGMPALVFPLYVDKVVVDRVIRMEPSTITVPAPQIYISPLITVPAPVVNVQPADVRIASAKVVVQPAPVHVSPVIEPATVWTAVAAISLSLLIGAGLIGYAIRAHAKALRNIAVLEVSGLVCQTRVNAENWRSITKQVIADTTGQVITVEALLSMSVQPVPTMRFRATNSQVFIFSLNNKPDEIKQRRVQTKSISDKNSLVAVFALHDIWCFFAAFTLLPSHLPRTGKWHIVVTSNFSVANVQIETPGNVDFMQANQSYPDGQKATAECKSTLGLRSSLSAQIDEPALDRPRIQDQA